MVKRNYKKRILKRRFKISPQKSETNSSTQKKVFYIPPLNTVDKGIIISCAVYFIVLFLIFINYNTIANYGSGHFNISHSENYFGGVISCDLFFNEPNIFMSQDLSQAEFDIKIYASDDIYRKYEFVKIEFENLADFSNLSIQPDKITHHSIEYIDPHKIHQIFSKGLYFYARFPELQNKQAIRTFLVTAFLVFFFQEVFRTIFSYLRSAQLEYPNKE